jgi:glycosyltransferase involved in cell wall biosynthesis
MECPMKILHLLSQVPGGTGSGVTVQALIRESARRGYENFLLAGIPSGCSPDLSSLPEESCAFVEFESEKLPFRVVGMSDVMPYPSTRFFDLTEIDLARYRECFLSAMGNAVASFQPDIIHSHHLWIVTSLARRAYPLMPLITTCHGSDLRQYHLCPHLRPFVYDGCSGLDRVLVLSRAQKREVMSLYGLSEERVVITGVGYDEELFKRGEKPPAPPVRLLYAGKLSRAKGVLWLLKALRQVIELPWELHIAGSGSGLEREEILTEAGGMEGRVIFHGALPQADLAELMRNAHIFILPSFYEGFPLVLIEALASGCRLIATSLPAVKELFSTGVPLADILSIVSMPDMKGPDVPEETSLPLFTDNLSHSIAQAIRKASASLLALDDEVEALVRGFTWSGVFDRVEREYKELLQQGL